MTPELSRPLEVAAVPPDGRQVVVTAKRSERALLASRFGIPAIDQLECRFLLRPLAGGGLQAEGELSARVRQVCVVSDEEFPADVAEAFSLRFVPPQSISAEIAVDGPDEVPITGASVDLGEAAAEQLALALDPYPRRPDLPAEPALNPAAEPELETGAAPELNPKAEPELNPDEPATSPFAILRRRA